MPHTVIVLTREQALQGQVAGLLTDGSRRLIDACPYDAVSFEQRRAAFGLTRFSWKGHSLAREKVLALSRLDYGRSSSATSEIVIDLVHLTARDEIGGDVVVLVEDQEHAVALKGCLQMRNAACQVRLQ